MAVDEQRKIIDFVEKPADPPPHAGQPEAVSLASMGIYIFNAEYLYDAARATTWPTPTPATTSARTSSRARCAKGARWRIRSRCPAVSASADEASPYWRDVGTIDAFWEANIDLTSVTPELNMYDTELADLDLPARSCRRPSSCTTPRANTASAINTMVSGGCIVSGSS